MPKLDRAEVGRLIGQFALLAAKAGWSPKSIDKISALGELALADGVRMPILAQPAAWLEVDHNGLPLGVSIERDYSSPFTWKPLYSAAPSTDGGRWIPVGERLPKEYERVLIWFLDHEEPFVRFGHIASGHWRPEGGNGNFDDVVTHWQPLPTPPEKESHE